MECGFDVRHSCICHHPVGHFEIRFYVARWIVLSDHARRWVASASHGITKLISSIIMTLRDNILWVSYKLAALAGDILNEIADQHPPRLLSYERIVLRGELSIIHSSTLAMLIPHKRYSMPR